MAPLDQKKPDVDPSFSGIKQTLKGDQKKPVVTRRTPRPPQAPRSFRRRRRGAAGAATTAATTAASIAIGAAGAAAGGTGAADAAVAAAGAAVAVAGASKAAAKCECHLFFLGPLAPAQPLRRVSAVSFFLASLRRRSRCDV